MANINIVVLGAAGYSEGLGKKGTSTDITFYNLKRGESTVTFIEPSKYPERLAPLFYAVSTARKAILVVDEINPTFGELVVMLHCAGVENGFLVLRNYLPKEKVLPLIKGTVVENYAVVADDRTALREKLLEEADGQSSSEPPPGGEKGIVLTDHSFNVKGVGVVVLGSVEKGSIRVHEDLKVLPSGKTAAVRSIQKHDDDFDWAGEGDRVGLALKNIDLEDIERGTVFTNDESVKLSISMECKANIIRYWQAPIKEGMVLHLGHWMQFLPAKVESVTDEGDWRRPTLRLKFEKALVSQPDGRAVLAYLEGGKLRVMGTAVLP
jgi:selenocysteine-specific translation elongation factor